MTSSGPSSLDPSRVGTPNRFTSQASTAEDLLKSQTVGLVHLSDFRKRRAEALEQKEREAAATHGGRFTLASAGSGAVTPGSANDDGASMLQEQRPKKKRKPVAKGKLSFTLEDEQHEHEDGLPKTPSSAATPGSTTPTLDHDNSSRSSSAALQEASPPPERKRLGPNSSVSIAPKTMTKGALLREAQTREQLRKDFLLMQDAVKATEIVIPFVFYDGTNIPGGRCKVKKGDQVWLFLDRGRKVGAERGVGGGEKSVSRKEWARVGVDDLILVRGEVIIPHHYEIYHFIVNKTVGPNGKQLFDYASTMEIHDPQGPFESDETYDPISVPSKTKIKNNGQATEADQDLEGADDNPTFTKVVDRRWYERNKHIFPASVWEEYDPGKDYSNTIRKDAKGNAFFFT